MNLINYIDNLLNYSKEQIKFIKNEINIQLKRSNNRSINKDREINPEEIFSYY